jgi:hypothetical protein
VGRILLLWLFELVSSSGMEFRRVFNSFPYDLSDILSEAVFSRTYLCEIV